MSKTQKLILCISLIASFLLGGTVRNLLAQAILKNDCLEYLTSNQDYTPYVSVDKEDRIIIYYKKNK